MMLTYLNDPALKAAFLAEIGKHEQADQLVKGTYGQMNGVFKGCAIGCSLHSLNVLQGRTDLLKGTRDHARYETELGIPIWLAYLEDHLFETLTDEESQVWPRAFAEAIPVGAVVDDLVLARILRWTLADPKVGVRHATDNEEIRGYIDGVIAGFDAEISTGGQADARAARAAWAAWAARAARAAWAAWAARDAWAARAAWDAWAAWAAWDAWAARDAWDAWAARAAWDARDAWDAWAARAAWDARDAWADLHNGAKAALFSSALSRYVLEELRALKISEGR